MEIWFEDEARVGQQGTCGAVCNEAGFRPAAVRDDRHDSVWLFGSLCPQRAVGSALVMPWVGSEAMSLHLDAPSKVVSPGAHAVLVRAGAGWHQTGGQLVVPDDVTLLPLPSCSPQLKPIENVWAYLLSVPEASWFSRILRAAGVSGCLQDACAEQLEPGPTVHRALQHLDPAHLAFDGTGGPWQHECSADRIEVVAQARREPGER